MSRMSNAELMRRLEQLEAENLALKTAGALPPGPITVVVEQPSTRRRSWPWTLLATVLIIIGAVLAPVAVVASWAKIELTDTDRFVSTYAPLASSPEIQSFVTDQAVEVINQQVDVPELTSNVIDGVIELGTGPKATVALNALKGPAAAGIQSLIHNAVNTFVASDAFANVWSEALRLSHTQLVSAMNNDENSALQIGGNGSIGIQLAPIIAAVKTALLANGFDFASQIPEVDRIIVVAQADALPNIQLAYGLAVAAGQWLPWVSLIFLFAGVLVARRKPIAVIWAAIALALAMAITLAALAIGKVAFIATISPSALPSDVADLLYSTVVGIMQSASLAVLVLALAVAVVAWFAGPFRTPKRLRGFFNSGTARLRAMAEDHGITTGRVGEWCYRQRALLRAAIAVIAAVIIVFVRPLTAGVIIWTLVIAVVVLVILELVQRPDADNAAPEEVLVEEVVVEEPAEEPDEEPITEPVGEEADLDRPVSAGSLAGASGAAAISSAAGDTDRSGAKKPRA